MFITLACSLRYTMLRNLEFSIKNTCLYEEENILNMLRSKPDRIDIDNIKYQIEQGELKVP